MSEVARALGIPGKNSGLVYTERLLKAHMLKHYPFLPERGYPMLDAKGVGTVAKGEFVENAARCELCRPALNAARKPDTEVSAKMAIAPRMWAHLTTELHVEAVKVADEEKQEQGEPQEEEKKTGESPDEQADHSREYRIGG